MGITSVTEERLNAAGKANIIIFDKTGTLTEEEFDIHGFQSTSINNNILDFNNVEKTSRLYNLLHREFWRTFCFYQSYYENDNYQENVKNATVYFLECMACCHDINKINDSYMGRSIDIKIFNNLNWIIEKCPENPEGVSVFKSL